MISKEINKALDYMKQYVENIYEHDSEPMLNWKDLKLVLDYIEQKDKALLDIKEYIEKSFDNQDFEIRKTYEDDELIGIGYYFNGNDILDIVNKALGDKENEWRRKNKN